MKLSCSLYTKERLAIIKAMVNESNKLINSRRDLYGACMYTQKFNRYTRYATSTDEGQTRPERVDASITSEHVTKRGM